MFNRRAYELIDKLENRIISLELKVELLEKRPEPKEPEKVDIEGLHNKIDAKLLAFYKEAMEKVLASIESVMRDHREISLIEALAKNVKEEDFSKLRVSLMQPIIEARNEAERKKEAQKIESNVKTLGEQLFDKKNELERTYLEMNRKKQDTKEIEHKLEMLNWVIGTK